MQDMCPQQLIACLCAAAHPLAMPSSCLVYHDHPKPLKRMYLMSGHVAVLTQQVTVDNDTYGDRTIITVDSANRPGTLVEVVQCLTELGLNVKKARISSDGG